MTYRIRIAMVVFLLSWSFSGSAHHSSNPHFDKTKSVDVNGVITEIKMVNPHAYLYFTVEENGELENWRCELSSGSQLRRFGWTDTLFAAGKKVNIVGNPARREDNVCFLEKITFADGMEMARNTDLTKEVPKVTDAADKASERPLYLENGQPNLQGPWVTLSFGRGSVEGKRPSYEATEAGTQAAEGYEAEYDDPILFCHIVNVFNGWVHDANVNDIVQYDDKILMKYGFMDFVRTIHLNIDAHPENIEPSTGGHSIGRFEDDVLVVETSGFEEGVLGHLTGMKHSDQMRSVERFRFDAKKQQLIRDYTVVDPLYLEGEAVGQDVSALSDLPYSPYNCTELSGKNNVRPTDARYNDVDESGLLMAVDKSATASAAPVAASNVPDVSTEVAEPAVESSSLAKWWWLPILVIVFFTVLRLMRRSSSISE